MISTTDERQHSLFTADCHGHQSQQLTLRVINSHCFCRHSPFK